VASRLLKINRKSTAISFALAILFALTIGVGRAANGQTFSVIHTFTGPDGWYPSTGLTLDSGGNLYGTTVSGGANEGTVFKMTRHGSDWILTTLFDFNSSDGYSPLSPVAFGPDGALYGTAQFGGLGAGVVFKLTPPAHICSSVSCPWTQVLLHEFDGKHGTPLGPSGPLSFDAAGNIYGTTQLGGDYNSCIAGGLGCGTVYELTKSLGWQESTLHAFTQRSDGEYPYSGVILDAAGNLYGTDPGGVVFELSPSGSGWAFQILTDFSGNEGAETYAGLIWDQAGNLYGANAYGGTGQGGTAFKLSPTGGNWNVNLLFSFTGNGGLNDGPESSLMMDSAGNLYGTTFEDGADGCGSAFKLTPSNGSYIYTSLHDFTCGSDGGNPISTLVMDADGNLFGTTTIGGNPGGHNCDGLGCGVVFEIAP